MNGSHRLLATSSGCLLFGAVLHTLPKGFMLLLDLTMLIVVQHSPWKYRIDDYRLSHRYSFAAARRSHLTQWSKISVFAISIHCFDFFHETAMQSGGLKHFDRISNSHKEQSFKSRPFLSVRLHQRRCCGDSRQLQASSNGQSPQKSSSSKKVRTPCYCSSLKAQTVRKCHFQTVLLSSLVSPEILKIQVHADSQFTSFQSLSACNPLSA